MTQYYSQHNDVYIVPTSLPLSSNNLSDVLRRTRYCMNKIHFVSTASTTTDDQIDWIVSTVYYVTYRNFKRIVIRACVFDTNRIIDKNLKKLSRYIVEFSSMNKDSLFQHIYYNEIIKVFYQNKLVDENTKTSLHSDTLISKRIFKSDLRTTPYIENNITDIMTSVAHMISSECIDVRLNGLTTLCTINSSLHDNQISLSNNIILELRVTDFLINCFQQAVRIKNDHYIYLLFVLYNYYLRYNVITSLNKLRLNEYLLKFDIRLYDAYIFNVYMSVRQQLLFW